MLALLKGANHLMDTGTAVRRYVDNGHRIRIVNQSTALGNFIILVYIV